MTVYNAFKMFYRTKYRDGLLDKSLESYRLLINRFISFIGEDFQMEDITNENIELFEDSLFCDVLSRASIASYLRNTKIFLSWYQKKHDVKYNASEIKIPKTPKKVVHLYSKSEIELIFNSIHTCDLWLDARNKAIICLMLDSGLRQAEVCTLKKKNVRYDESILIVCGKGNKERRVPLHKMTAQTLQKYLSICPYESENVFVGYHGNDLSKNAVKSMTYDMQKTLPFEFSSHKLRHNFATNYLINQYEKYGHMDIYQLMIIMGHEDVATVRRYLHDANSVIASRHCISHLDKLFLETG